MLVPKGKYDVIVVGAGPAGSTASYILSKNGLRVLLIDKYLFPRDKLCGGLLTEKSIRLIETIFKESLQSLKQHGAINLESTSYNLYYRSRLLLSGTSAISFKFVNRSDFDYLLLNHTLSSGTYILEEEVVKECNPSAGTILTKSGQVFSGRFIIGADGVSSIVRHYFPQSCYNHHDWQKRLTTGVATEISIQEFPWQVDSPMIYFGFLNFGYSWVFPKKEHILMGMGGITQKNPDGIHKCFRSFCSNVLASKNIPILNFRSYPIPFGNHLERPGHGLALLVGDAAGFADSIFGEGIYYAIKSGELAADAIIQGLKKNSLPLEIYFRNLRYSILPQPSYLKKRGDILYFMQRIFGYLGVRLFIKLDVKNMINNIQFLHEELNEI